MDKSRNEGLTVEEIKTMIADEQSKLNTDEIEQKAKKIYRTLKITEMEIKRNNEKYYKHNITYYDDNDFDREYLNRLEKEIEWDRQRPHSI